jgi:hypothetical protein
MENLIIKILDDFIRFKRVCKYLDFGIMENDFDEIMWEVDILNNYP